jgi:hypothetical protein
MHLHSALPTLSSIFTTHNSSFIIYLLTSMRLKADLCPIVDFTVPLMLPPVCFDTIALQT